MGIIGKLYIAENFLFISVNNKESLYTNKIKINIYSWKYLPIEGYTSLYLSSNWWTNKSGEVEGLTEAKWNKLFI